MYTVYGYQVRERATVLSPDIGTGFQFFGDDSQRFWPKSKVARLNPQRRKWHSDLEKASRGMNFSAMELSVLVHELKQQLRPRANQTHEPVRNEDEGPFPALKYGNELVEEITRGEQEIFDFKSLKRFIVIALSIWGN